YFVLTPPPTPIYTLSLHDALPISLVPEDERVAHDMQRVIDLIVDRGSFLPVQAEYAANAIVGFARLDGYAVGVVANQPAVLAGRSEEHTSELQSRENLVCRLLPEK